MIMIDRRDGRGRQARHEILGELPEWFGLPVANEAYERDADMLPTWIAFEGTIPIGILVLREHAEATEIWLIAVRRARRNAGGVGKRLVAIAEAEAHNRSARFLTVKTRGPSAPTPSAEYEETRLFYRACGFIELEEMLTLWDAENPALFMAKTLY